MAGGWPVGLTLAHAADLAANTTDTLGLAVPAGSTMGAKGAWVQVIAAAPSDFTHLLVILNNFYAYGFSQALDIGVGASGSEVVLLSNLVIGGAPVGGASAMVEASIPAGTRIAVRSASSYDGTDPGGPFVQIIGFDSGYAGSIATGYDTYGWSGTGAPQGVLVDPGFNGNAKDAYYQLTASVAHDLSGFFLGLDCQNAVPSSTAAASPFFLIDIAIGAAGSEKIILPNFYVGKEFTMDASSTIAMRPYPVFSPMMDIPIRAGTRIAARSQSNASSAPDSSIGVSLYGRRA